MGSAINTKIMSVGRPFGDVIEGLKQGYTFQRAGWNGAGMYIELQRPDAHSKMTKPYIFMRTAQGDLIPWLASQTDMLEDDWHRIEVVA